MDRLTERLKNGVIRRTDLKGETVMRRIAAYEDTGLTPEEIPHWIPAGERLPDIDTPVICYCNNSRLQNLYQRVGYWGADRSWHDSWDGREIPVTHWMPLPEPPKESAEAEKERQDDAEH